MPFDELTKQMINYGMDESFNDGIRAAIDLCERAGNLYQVRKSLPGFFRDHKDGERARAKSVDAEIRAMEIAWISSACEPWWEMSQLGNN